MNGHFSPRVKNSLIGAKFSPDWNIQVTSEMFTMEAEFFLSVTLSLDYHSFMVTAAGHLTGELGTT